MSESNISQRRNNFDLLLRRSGIATISIICIFLVIFLGSIAAKASSAFISYEIKVTFTKNNLIPKNEEEAYKFLQNIIAPQSNILDFFSINALEKLIKRKEADKEIWLPTSAKLADFLSNSQETIYNHSEKLIIQSLQQQNLIHKKWDFSFFTANESREPELAGIYTSLLGSIYTILICILIALPISICAAIYLEEFAPKNLLTTIIEININNLAAVPSIVFGLLGLSILINFFDLPRSSCLVAGITLSIMVLPVMIISNRQAIRAIPTSIKHAALALGATEIQVIMHHVLPLAIPGIITGVILSIARAIGETAPLILIGMVAFIVDPPHNILDPATAIPVQIFLWAKNPEYGFQAKTAAAILTLLSLLIMINMIAAYIRKKYEHKW